MLVPSSLKQRKSPSITTLLVKKFYCTFLVIEDYYFEFLPYLFDKMNSQWKKIKIYNDLKLETTGIYYILLIKENKDVIEQHIKQL